MRRFNLNEGTRTEVLEELEEYESNRARNGREDIASEYTRAISELRAGAEEVRVRFSVYRVVEHAAKAESA